MVYKPSMTHLTEAGAESPEDDSGTVRITIAIGRDTLNRLDEIVKRGGYGGRGRALDSTLEWLGSTVSHYQQTRDAFQEWSRAPDDSPEESKAGGKVLMQVGMLIVHLSKLLETAGPQPQGSKP